MIRALLLAAVLAVVGLLPAAGAAGPTGGLVTYDLEGGVDDDWSIWLTPPNGDNVRTLPPRSYVIDVSDSSKAFNFHLRGPGVDRATPVRGEEYTLWTVTLQPGTYEYFSDSEPQEMRETFTVSATAPPPPPAVRVCRVPRVVGMRLFRARTAIRRADCSVGRVRYVRVRRNPGRVRRQTPSAGTHRPVGSRVALVVGRRPR